MTTTSSAIAAANEWQRVDALLDEIARLRAELDAAQEQFLQALAAARRAGLVPGDTETSQ